MRKKHPFRHALLATVGTVSGLVLLLALKPTTDPSLAQAGRAQIGITAAASAPATPSASATASPSAAPSGSASPSDTPGKDSAGPSSTATASASSAPAAPARTSSAPSAPKTTTAAPVTRSVTGATVQTKYGPVQVRITLSGSRITGSTAVQYPDDAARSRDISSMAVPKLDQETLRAQSAQIDTVSGATYTSAGYRQSLQSALDRAGL
ncbi:FMN-binding protein [Streptomyces actuosus]|uniref:FMN-binding protein n=1 Tax=Streptomyces actuosus TaxID=1885 RepID=A0ABS2VZ70_STRAS|nr:FMN-binding protein [Streptomyces actuosus]MBN0048453.1 FMN-binding protein [Streptomyces actuosus]